MHASQALNHLSYWDIEGKLSILLKNFKNQAAGLGPVLALLSHLATVSMTKSVEKSAKLSKSSSSASSELRKMEKPGGIKQKTET